MPFVAISRCVKFELIYEWGDVGKVLANVLHFQAQTFNVDYTAQITSDNCNTWMTFWGDKRFETWKSDLYFLPFLSCPKP